MCEAKFHSLVPNSITTLFRQLSLSTKQSITENGARIMQARVKLLDGTYLQLKNSSSTRLTQWVNLTVCRQKNHCLQNN